MQSQITPWLHNPWLGMLVVLVSLSLLMGGLKWLQARFNPHPEIVRKLLHTIMGLVTLTFPWLFQATWPVWLLAGISIVALSAVKYVSFMNKQLGDVIDGVKRRSLGDLYFPLAVAIVFQLAQARLELYLVPIMLLTFADAVAALIGVRFGSMQYQTTEGVKSVQGSLAFFVVAFIGAVLPLLAYSTLSVTHIILISITLGVLVMMFEAIAWRGLDNLFIPLGAFFLLEKYYITSEWGLLLRCGILLLLFLLVFAWRKRTPLNEGAALSTILVLYAIGVLGGAEWLVAPVLLFAGYAVLVILARQQGNNDHTTFAIMSIAAGPLLWLFVAQRHEHPLIYLAYVAGFSIQFGLISLANMSFRWPQRSAGLLIGYATGLAMVLGTLVLLVGLVTGTLVATSKLVLPLVLMVAAVVVSLLVFRFWQPQMHDCPVDTNRWLRQGLIGLLGSGIVLFAIL